MASIKSAPSEGAGAARFAPEPKPVRGAEQERLGVFVGDWRGQGAGGDGTPMVATEIYDWIEGRFFLSSRFDQRVGRIGTRASACWASIRNPGPISPISRQLRVQPPIRGTRRR
jgi:hypothetical protein